MSEIRCFDSEGNSIDYLTQWDVNQTLYIEDWEYESIPIFHLCNIKSDKALVVEGEIENGKGKFNVPNILLQEPYPIAIFVYLEEGTVEGNITDKEANDKHVSGKSIYTIQIPVRKKIKPIDYELRDNTEYISWVRLTKEMEYIIKNLAQQGEELIGDLTESAMLASDSAENANSNSISATKSATDANASAKIAHDAAEKAQYALENLLTSSTITIIGTFTTYNDLIANRPVGDVGDAYLVNGDLYIWDSNSSSWVNAGHIQGAEGVSCTHQWEGTVLSVTSASGTSSSDLKGEKGDKGEKGADGTSVTILGSYDTYDELISDHPTGAEGESYIVGGDLYVWSANEGSWINAGAIKGEQGATFTPHVAENGDLSWTNDMGLANPTTVNIKGKDGVIGKDGASGEDGYTPIRGTDYWTTEDINTIKSYVNDAIINGRW